MNVKVLLPSVLALAVSANLHAADFEFDGNSTLKLSGDLELDTDFRDGADEGQNALEQNGRILLNIEGEKVLASGNYAKVMAQPLLKVDGDVSMDDAYGEFGRKDDWSVRVGRYEAIDLFPMGQDTFVDDANEGFGGVAMYQANEGRGRAGKSGQAMVTKIFGNVYTEVGALFGSADDMGLSYGDAGVSSASGAYTTIVRPAVQYRGNGWNLTAGVEAYVSDETVKVEGIETDISDRFGYGVTFNYQMPVGNLNVSYADLSSDDFNALTYGINAVINQWGFGYIHGENSYEGALASVGDTNADTLYGSYIWDQAIGVDNFQMHFGAYYAQGELDGTGTDDDEIGGRVRLKYFF